MRSDLKRSRLRLKEQLGVLRVSLICRISPWGMELTEYMLVDVAQLVNLYPVQHQRLDKLEANSQTGEFHAMDQQLDKCHLMTICSGG